MNAISVTMVKGTDSQTLHDHAFRLTVAMVLLSWVGWQMLLISGCYHWRGFPDRATDFLEVGLVLLLYSLHLLLRLKRKDAAPARESAQLFFGAFIIALPGMTWIVWHQLGRVLTLPVKAHSIISGSNIALRNTSLVISVIYAVVILIWLQTNVPYYSQARNDSWSRRIMQRLKLWVVDPYFKE